MRLSADGLVLSSGVCLQNLYPELEAIDIVITDISLTLARGLGLSMNNMFPC